MKKYGFLVALALALSACSGGKVGSIDPPGSGSPSPSVDASGNPIAPPSGSGAPSAKPSGSAKPSPTGSHTDDGDDHEGEEPHEDDKNKYTADRPPSSDFRDPDVDGGGKLPLQIKISPGCVENGQTMTVVFRTKGDVQTSFFTNWAGEDGKIHATDGRTARDGTWTRQVQIPQNLQPQQYELLAAAADDNGTSGGRSGTWFFVVAEPGRCRK